MKKVKMIDNMSHWEEFKTATEWEEAGTALKELRPGMVGVVASGEIVRLFPLKTFQKYSGETGSLYSFILEDGTGEVRVVLWNTIAEYASERFFEGNFVRIRGGFTKVGFNEMLELQCDQQSHIEGIEFKQKEKRIEFQPIGSIQKEDKWVNVEGVIVEKFPVREYSSASKRGVIGELMLEDETGRIKVCFWDGKVELFQGAWIKEGSKLKLKRMGVRYSSYLNELQLSFTSDSSIIYT